MSQAGMTFGLPCFLIVAALWDVRYRTIPNFLTGSMAVAGAAVSFSGLGFSSLPAALLTGAISFLVGLLLQFARLVGGGDVKLFAAMAIWLGPAATVDAALGMAVAGGLLAFFFLRRPAPPSGAAKTAGPESWVGRLQLDDGRDFDRVPYGVAVAAGGLWVWLSHFGLPGGWS